VILFMNHFEWLYRNVMAGIIPCGHS
jgi:hypothetical protein